MKSFSAGSPVARFRPFAGASPGDSGRPKVEIVDWSQLFDDTVAPSLRKLQQDLLTYVQSRSYLKQPLALFRDQPESWGKTLQHKTNKKPVWFIGDLHGDLLSLKLLTDFALENDRKENKLNPEDGTNLFFLGDFIDDGKFSADVMAWLFAAANEASFLEAKFNIMAVAGNHDAALIYDDTHNEFFSNVRPSSFFEQLNDNSQFTDLGNGIIEFFKNLPRMVLLDDTVMAIHGGVPHLDVTSTLKKLEDIYSPGSSLNALRNFTWGRLDETEAEISSWHSQGMFLAWKDFNAFVNKFSKVLYPGVLPSLALRGHDHQEDNYKHFVNYTKCKVITINALTANRSRFGKKFNDLAIVRWQPSDDPEAPLDVTIYKIKISEVLVKAINWNDDFKSIIEPD